MNTEKLISAAKVAAKCLLKVVVFLAAAADRSIVRVLNRR